MNVAKKTCEVYGTGDARVYRFVVGANHSLMDGSIKFENLLMSLGPDGLRDLVYDMYNHLVVVDHIKAAEWIKRWFEINKAKDE